MNTLELLDKVADGSAAEAFLARNEKETVLVELSRPGLSDDIELYGRFLDEARARQSLKHRNLVELKEAGCRKDGRLFAVTESLSGAHLGSLGALAAEQTVEFLIPLCEALSYLHSRGVVHGHLRPSHVFLSGPQSAPVPKLLDMGLLLFRSTKSLKTPAKLVLVPPEYLSPERICGQRASPRSDVYGLGVLAFELATGRPPFKGATAEETRRLHMTAPVPQLPEGALWLQPWLNRCLQKDLAARFSSMEETRDALIETHQKRNTPRDALGTVSIRSGYEPPPLPPRPSDARLLGPYRLIELLGEGGMGQVWLAEHTKLERKVAIKLLKPELVRQDMQVQRFFDEARAVNKVNHPHIVEISDFVEERQLGRVWCVMEYLRGSTLKVVGRDQPLSIARSAGIVRQVCDALEAAHRVGVVHRDIKPDNIFLVEGKGEDDFVKVLDFGVAKLRSEKSARHTDTGEIVGTPAYMSPEQALGQEVDARSDLYSLGTLLYVLLAGRFPFDGVTAAQVVANIVSKPALPLPEVARSGEEIDPLLARIVMKCLEKHAGWRWSSMAALSEALLQFETTSQHEVLTEADFHIEDTGQRPVAVDGDEEESRGRGKIAWVGVAAAALLAVAVAGRYWPVERGAEVAGAGSAVQGVVPVVRAVEEQRAVVPVEKKEAVPVPVKKVLKKRRR